MTILNTKRMFPCPVCGVATDVRITKKDKAYITCDPGGVQVFVRGPAGISSFNRLVARGETIMETRISAELVLLLVLLFLSRRIVGPGRSRS